MTFKPDITAPDALADFENPPRAVFVAVLPNVIEPASHRTDCFNIVRCVEGRSRHWIAGPDGARPIELSPGECLVRAPGTWVGLEPIESYTSVGLTLGHRFTGLYCLRWVRRGGRHVRQDLWRHIDRSTLWPAGRYICQSLRVAADRPPDDPVLKHLLAALGRIVAEQLSEPAAARPRPNKAAHTFEVICEYVRDHCDQALTRQHVAEALNLAPRHVSRLFARFGGGETFQLFLRRIRLERAASLLASPSLNIAQISARCGFRTPGLFTRAFKSTFGLTPTAHRRGEFDQHAPVGRSSQG